MAENSNENAAGTQNPAFDIIRLYVKDLSLETPNTPNVFQKEWKPETKLDLDVKHNVIDDAHHVYEVVLRITATVSIGGETAFLAEVNQAGIFHIENFPEQQVDHMLNAFIPNIASLRLILLRLILRPFMRRDCSSRLRLVPRLRLKPSNV